MVDGVDKVDGLNALIITNSTTTQHTICNKQRQLNKLELDNDGADNSNAAKGEASAGSS